MNSKLFFFLMFVGVALTIPVLPEEVLDYHFLNLGDILNTPAVKTVVPYPVDESGKHAVCSNSAAESFAKTNSLKLFEWCDKEFVACFKSQAELKEYIASAFDGLNVLTLRTDSNLGGAVATVQAAPLVGNVTNLMPCHNFLDYVVCHDLHNLKATHGMNDFHAPTLVTMMVVGGSRESTNAVGQAVFIDLNQMDHSSVAHILKPEIDHAYFTFDAPNVIADMRKSGHSSADMAVGVADMWNKYC